MVSTTDIPFAKIPHQSALFLKYLQSSPAALRFYPAAPTLDCLAHAARALIHGFRFPRNELSGILRNQNKSYGCPEETLDRIAELERPDSVAVVTGQQVGLFGGPLYTVYKAMTAIQLARKLTGQGIRAVPVFWMETEDHDLPEATHSTVVGADFNVRNMDYRQVIFAKEDAPPGASVGSIPFPDKIVEAVKDYSGHLPEGPGLLEIKSQLESAYRPGATFAQSFGELMTRLFAGTGLILFDPGDVQAKRLNAAIIQKAILREDAIREALHRRDKELETSGFHSQVSVAENSTVLFFFEGGVRRALERTDSGFALKNTDRAFSTGELLQCAARNPERFSPNVLLRPLLQDHLFPTVAYVGGAAEVAYFAQIQILYELYGRPMPVIWPRNSYTLLEPDVAAGMDRMGLSFEELFQGRQRIIEKAVQSSAAVTELDRMRDRLESTLARIKPELQAFEPPLAQALETAERKILHNVQRFKLQAVRLEASHRSTVAGSVDFVLNHCYPNQTLQERQLGIHHFYARYGSSVLNAILSVMNVSSFMHQVIRL